MPFLAPASSYLIAGLPSSSFFLSLFIFPWPLQEKQTRENAFTMGEETDVAHEEVAQPPAQRPRQPTFLGQTKAEWYIYWICGVASIANM